MAVRPKQMVKFDSVAIPSDGLDARGHMGEYFDGVKFADDFLPASSTCDFCNTPLTFVQVGETWAEVENGEAGCALLYCPNCRFWAFRVGTDLPVASPEPIQWTARETCPATFINQVCVSKAAEFPTELPPGCDAEIAAYVRRHPGLLRRMAPARFERLVADIYRANHRHAEVMHVGRPGDGGVDIHFVDDGVPHIISVKRRGPEREAEEVATIRDLLGVLVLEGCRHGIVVSSADRFSPAAREATRMAAIPKSLTPLGFEIDLVDEGRLDRMLDPVLPDRPWLKPLKESNPRVGAVVAELIPSDRERQGFLFEPEPLRTAFALEWLDE